MSRRLFRSRDDRMLAGVAGGLAELWDADPSLVRVLWVILVPFTGGFALLAYVIMAFVVPEEGNEPEVYPPPGNTLAAEPGSTPAADGTAPPTTGAAAAPQADWLSARRDRREARRQARRTRRSGSGNGGLLIGALLVMAGVYFLVREYIPTIDVNWLWPAALIVLGVVVLASAFRGPSGGSTPPGPRP
jgi:phage shock protein PspC (stress-responsive transcriptional regulator)